jgi:hypothetical protein
MGVFVLFIPLIGALTVWLAHRFFGVAIWMGVIAVPLIFVFTVIGVNSTALTSIADGFGQTDAAYVRDPRARQHQIDLMTAGITIWWQATRRI